MPADGVTSIASNAFLGVDRSLSGRAWRERPADLAVVREIQQRHGLIEPLARALVSRGVTLEQAKAVLEHAARSSLATA